MTLTLTTPAELVERLGPAENYLVVVDFDGTLSPIVERPEQARPAEGAEDALQALAARTTVAVVSGRPVADLQARLTALPLVLVGGHGAEVRHRDGELESLIDRTAVADSLDRVEEEIGAAVGAGTGWLVERKSTSLAVHHRLVPEDEESALLPRVRALLDARTDDPPGFEVLVGHAVLELRPDGVDKGRALIHLLEREPGRTPLAIGDDRTDEDAFAVAVERDGVAVLVSEEARLTAAQVRLADPDAVVAMLAGLATRPGTSEELPDEPT